MHFEVLGLGYALPGAKLVKDDRGVSETFTGMIEVGPRRIRAHIKFLPGKRLINELVASVLAAAVDVPMPRGFLVLANRADFPESDVLKASPSDTGFGFACATMDHPSLRRRMRGLSPEVVYDILRAWKGWAEAIAFDDWIANFDRHEGNLLIGGPGEVWLIDNERSFLNMDWQPPDLSPAQPTANVLCERMKAAGLPEAERRQHLQGVHALVRKSMRLDPVDAITAARVAATLTVEETEALRTFLSERPSTIVSRVAAALGVPELPLG